MSAAAEDHEHRTPTGNGRFFHELLNPPPGRFGVEPVQIAACLRMRVAPTERTQSQMGHAEARSGHAPILPIHDETLIQDGLAPSFAERHTRRRVELVEGRRDSIRAPPQGPDIRELLLEQAPVIVAQTRFRRSGL
jgi:hypothetical protein